MPDIKIGDFVLVEHSFLQDAYQVRQVKSVTEKMVKLLRLDNGNEEVRAMKFVLGTFPDEQTARDVLESNYASYKKMMREKTLAVTAHRDHCMSKLRNNA